MRGIESFSFPKSLIFPPAFVQGFIKALKRGETVFLAEGEPGTGKTTIGRALGEHIARQGGFFVFAQMNHWASDEELIRGVDLEGFVARDPSKVYAAGVLLKALREAERVGFGVVLLDEWDKTRPAADALLYAALQERVLVDATGRVWGRFPKDVIFYITSNAMRPLSEPLLRRAFRIRFPPLPSRALSRLLQQRAGLGQNAAKVLARMAEEARRAGHPLTLPDALRMAGALRDADSIAEARFMLAAYVANIPRRDPIADLWAAVGRDNKRKGE